MILDSSAVVAVILEERGYEVLLAKLIAASEVAIGAPTLTEVSIVLSRKLLRNPQPELQFLFTQIGAQVIPFTEDHHIEALLAFERFGKGRHPASLNFGDCLAYATAKIADEPLLYVGNDFPKADVRTA